MYFNINSGIICMVLVLILPLSFASSKTNSVEKKEIRLSEIHTIVSEGGSFKLLSTVCNHYVFEAEIIGQRIKVGLNEKSVESWVNKSQKFVPIWG